MTHTRRTFMAVLAATFSIGALPLPGKEGKEWTLPILIAAQRDFERHGRRLEWVNAHPLDRKEILTLLGFTRTADEDLWGLYRSTCLEVETFNSVSFCTNSNLPPGTISLGQYGWGTSSRPYCCADYSLLTGRLGPVRSGREG